METFGMIFGFLIPFIFIMIVIFAIATVMEGKNTMRKGQVIRTLYFYLASLITLAIVVGSVVFLINLGLKAYLFPEANSNSYYGPPSPVYLDTTSTEASKPVPAPGSTILQCTDGCSLTEAQKTNIQSWKTNYQNWKDNEANPGARNARDAVAALSFLIVALPFFIIHFRMVQKSAREQDEDHSVLRPTYFYFVSLSSLLMMVIAGGFLINIALKTWVFPAAGRFDDNSTQVYPTAEITSAEKGGVQSIVTCGETCGLDEETVSLAEQWSKDYDGWYAQQQKRSNTRQQQAASAIPYVAVGIPLFLYHWSVVRREAKKNKDQVVPPPSA